MKIKHVPVFALIGLLAVLSGMPVLSSSIITNYALAKYATDTNIQTQANANECNFGTNCAINSPQTQGDGTANSPTNLQISKFNGEQQDSVSSGRSFNFDLTGCQVFQTSFNCQITNYVRGSSLICLDNPFRCNVHVGPAKFPVDCIVDSRVNPTRAICRDPTPT
jgi:hypothetical protein